MKTGRYSPRVGGAAVCMVLAWAIAQGRAETVITQCVGYGGALSLGWHGKSVRSYAVERSGSLLPDTGWQSLGGTNPAQDGPVCFAVAPTGAASFYRVSYVIPDYPPGYWAHHDLPQLTDSQRVALASG